jgi:ferric-dicitrate binding protein FerR (iron transport regulator)
MSKSYNEFELSDFLENKSFLTFAIGKNPKDQSHWEAWLRNNPPNKNIAEKAYQILNLMNNQGKQQVEFSKKEEFERLMYSIDHQRPVENDISGRSLQKLLKIAAAIIVLLSLGIAYLIVNPSESQDLTNAYNKITVPKGSKAKLEFEDGTKVWLNAESSLTYPSKFSKSERKVNLVGEAYFIVSKNPNRPFIVMTSGIRINVLGTSFNVKAYPQDNTIETTLESGVLSVEQLNLGRSSRENIILKPNQKLILLKNPLNREKKNSDNKSDSLQKKNLALTEKIQATQKSGLYKDIDTKTYTSWKEGKLIFKNEPLYTLASRLEKWYNINIQIADESLITKTYTGVFEKETVEQALKAICLTSDINFKIDKNNVIIYE